MKKGLLFVISGPSGAGKGTILEKVFRDNPQARFSVSATTRAPREGEIDGVHYFFIDEDKFWSMVEKEEFLEWAKVHNQHYGTPRKFVDKTLDEGFDCILDIDVQGALQVMQKKPEAVYIFIAPPYFAELENRLKKRGTDDLFIINQRLEDAKWELTKIAEYDYLEKAIADVNAIIRAEKCSIENMAPEAERLVNEVLSLGKE